MFKYNMIVTISRLTDDILIPLFRFTMFAKDMDEAQEEAATWVVDNVPYDERDGIHCEIEEVEQTEAEEFRGV